MIKRFSDFATEQGPLEGEKIKLDEVVNKEIIVTNFKIKESKYQNSNNKNCLTIQFKENENDKEKVIFTGSSILAEQCKKYQDNMPFATTIKKINKYYTFT